MIPTLLVGDHIFVDKLPFQSWERGSVAIFKYPENTEQDFAKRIIATPGETLVVKSGHPWINGWEVPHCEVGRADYEEDEPGVPADQRSTHKGTVEAEFLGTEAYLVFLEDDPSGFFQQEGPFKVNAREVYVLGDNRMNSHDSRFWGNRRGRGVDDSLMKGRALIRWFTNGAHPFSRFGSVRTPVLPESMANLQPGLDKCLAARPSLDKTTPPPAAPAAPTTP
jgi:signal peptidase I